MSCEHDPEKINHPSYGMIGWNRIRYGGEDPGTVLVGCSIKHSETIRLRIKPMAMERNLNRDWHFAREPAYIEVELSQNQFAEFITAPGKGDGVPCTVRYVNGERIPEPQFENKQDLFVDEFRKDAAEVAKICDEAIAFAIKLLDKPSVTKAERQSMLGLLGNIKQNIASNMPFVADQFNRQMEQTVTEAKCTIDAFVMHTIHDLGMEALRTQIVSLPDKTEDIVIGH